MRICALDTSSAIGTFVLAEVSDGKTTVCAEREQRVSNAHGESILPLLDEACRELGWEPSSIRRWIVGIGPGSFTGARIATSLVKGVVMATGAEVSLVTTFEAFVAGHQTAIVLVDAMKGDRYAQVWRDGQAGEPVYLPAVAIEAWLRSQLDTRSDSILVGHVPIEVSTWARVELREFMRAADMIDIGLRNPAATDIEPLYVRSADIHMGPAHVAIQTGR